MNWDTAGGAEFAVDLTDKLFNFEFLLVIARNLAPRWCRDLDKDDLVSQVGVLLKQ